VYNKPNGCSATGALAPGSDHQQQQQQHYFGSFTLCSDTALSKSHYVVFTSSQQQERDTRIKTSLISRLASWPEKILMQNEDYK
jgi:hypothetical protein